MKKSPFSSQATRLLATLKEFLHSTQLSFEDFTNNLQLINPKYLSKFDFLKILPVLNADSIPHFDPHQTFS